MKKKNIDNKGFAMAELLAISVVILLIFSILVSNYLPLVAEYENRIDYTNVTANYAAFQFRKAYKSLLENSDNYNFVTTALSQEPYYIVYDASNDAQTSPNLVTNERQKVKLNSFISDYGIELIIITKYQLTDIKGLSKSKLKSDHLSGLYGFIQYLPSYKKLKNGSSERDPYRIIIKTRDFGYATMPILTDPPTPESCFGYEAVTGGYAITAYYPNKTECKSNAEDVVFISTHNSQKVVEVKNKMCNSDVKLNTIFLPESITTIGANAFENCGLKRFNFFYNAPGVKNVGSNAFSNNLLTKIVIPDGITFGNGAFSNNVKLESIDIDYNNTNISKEISESMFEVNSNNPNFNKQNQINVTIPNNVTKISKYAFRNLKVNSLTFKNGSRLESIEDEAFANTNLKSVTLPSSVMALGSNVFKNTNVGDDYEDNLLEIRNEELFNQSTSNIDWCNVLHGVTGQACTFEKETLEGEKYNNYTVYKCTYNNKSKYVTYIEGGNNNE